MNGNSPGKDSGRVLPPHLPPRRSLRSTPRGGPKRRHPPISTTAPQQDFVDFYGRDFMINSDVLIPRPETEMVVDAVLNLAGKAYLPGVKPAAARLPGDCRVIDVGTGSGCIAITLKLELPELKVMGADISEKALAVARKNAHRLGAKVNFGWSDLMDDVKGEFDLVIANLPYVDENWDWLDKQALEREPALALYAEDGGLALIKRLVGQVAERGVGFLVLEADPCQHERIIEYAEDNGYKIIEMRGYSLVFEYGAKR